MITANDRLIIRELEAADAPVLYDLYSNKEAMQYRGSKALDTLSEAIAMVTTVEEQIANGTAFRYGIVLRATGALAGTFLITPVSDTVCKVGCSFGQRYWRQGLGRETMHLMANYLKMQGHRKLMGLIQKANVPSVRLVEQLQYSLIAQTAYPNFYQYEKDL